MGNLSHVLIIEDVLIENHILQRLISEYGEDIPELVLQSIDRLDNKMRQFGEYWNVYGKLKDEGVVR